MSKININTAPYRVISALTDNMTDDVVTEIITMRLGTPIKSIDEIRDLIDSNSFENLKKNILTVKSSIFSIRSTYTLDGVSVSVNAVYNRDTKKFLYWSEE